MKKRSIRYFRTSAQTRVYISKRIDNNVLYHPRSFLVIGSLAQFQTEHGINEDKYSSFELFRRNIASPEIVTFDELYSRATYIVEASKAVSMGSAQSGSG